MLCAFCGTLLLEHLLLFRYRRRCLFLPGSRTGTSALASGPLDREFKLEQERNGTYETTFTPPRGGRRVRRASGLPADCLWRGDHRGDPVCCTGIPRTADGAGCGGNPHRDGCGGQRGGGSGGAQPHRGYPAALVLRDLCHRRHLWHPHSPERYLRKFSKLYSIESSICIPTSCATPLPVSRSRTVPILPASPRSSATATNRSL